MTTGRIELGPTGRTVAANVKRLREARGLTLRALSAELKSRGRPLSADALNKIENGASEEPRQVRRVDVDDLMALAVVLGVQPNALLLPVDTEPLTEIEVTGSSARVPALIAWEWADGQTTLSAPASGHAAYQAAMLYRLHGRPHWMVELEDEEETGVADRRSRLRRVTGLERDEATGRYRFNRRDRGDDGSGLD
ncbi:helix-turn-helix transcriptional regulator [Streptomyces sp. NPDC006265]|uniref:helix-turn-helix domain-containing protein n=1 Tax=Streptomyces sp. NPDC006265 TaxID=3156740 RepID=UPI0033B6386D